MKKMIYYENNFFFSFHQTTIMVFSGKIPLKTKIRSDFFSILFTITIINGNFRWISSMGEWNFFHLFLFSLITPHNLWFGVGSINLCCFFSDWSQLKLVFRFFLIFISHDKYYYYDHKRWTIMISERKNIFEFYDQ